MGQELGEDHKQKSFHLSESEKQSLVSLWRVGGPKGVARGMCDEFRRRFPDWLETLNSGPRSPQYLPAVIDFMAIPKDNTWHELEINLRELARFFHRGSEEDCKKNELFKYWDTMRSLWRATVGNNGQRFRRQVYRRQDSDSYETWESIRDIVNVSVCSFCWRAVFVRRGDCSRRLCHEHFDLGTGKEYQQRYRMLYGTKKTHSMYGDVLSDRYAQKLKLVIVGTKVNVGGCGESDQVVRTVDEAWQEKPSAVIDIFPHVKKYLLDKNINLGSAREIIKGLEEPLRNDEAEDVSQRREMFYADCELYFRFYVEHLVWAEVWLEREAEMVWGGRRPGAGRPRKEK